MALARSYQLVPDLGSCHPAAQSERGGVLALDESLAFNAFVRGELGMADSLNLLRL